MIRRILILDNFDSFIYNIVFFLQKNPTFALRFLKTDNIYIRDIDNYEKILISPGPGVPNHIFRLRTIVKKFYLSKSILGICLGLQAIAESFGALLKNKISVFHGMSTYISIISSEDKIWNFIPNKLKVGRYHSWIVSKNKIPKMMKITAFSLLGDIMAIRHKYYNVYGLQFHPESILTTYGEQILHNWLNLHDI